LYGSAAKTTTRKYFDKAEVRRIIKYTNHPWHLIKYFGESLTVGKGYYPLELWHNTLYSIIMSLLSGARMQEEESGVKQLRVRAIR
jgi:hypothetical protein